MNKKKKVSILLISILTLGILTGITIISNAVLNKIQREQLEISVDKSKLEQKSNIDLNPIVKLNDTIDEKLSNNIKEVAIKIAGQIRNNIEEIKESKIEKIYDKIKDKTYYNISTEKFEIELNEDLSLGGYINLKTNSEEDKEMKREEAKILAEKYIKDLRLDNEYKLTYLEPFMNNTWEAGYSLKSKELKDPYNMIKLFFGKNNGIETLRIFKTPIIETKEKISKEEAIKIVKNQFKDIEKIENIKKVMVKPNNFFTKEYNEEIKEKNKVIKAWEVTAIKKIKNWDKKYLIYVNIETGEIIAGHSMK